jgi:hypothetical protein
MTLRNYYNKTALKKKKKAELVDLYLDLQAELLDRIIDGDEAKAYQEKIAQLEEENKKLKEGIDDAVENHFADLKLRETTWKEWEKLEEENKKLKEQLDEQYSFSYFKKMKKLQREVKMWENAVDV